MTNQVDSVALLEELYEEAPCGYISTFPDGIFAKINQTFLAWTGYAHDELLGARSFQELLTPGGRIFYETHYLPLLHMQGFVREITFDLICNGGQRLPILINTVQKRDQTGTLVLHHTTIFSATDRRMYERELILARKQAEQTADHLIRLQTVMASLAEALTSARVAKIISEQAVTALVARAGLVAIVSDDGAHLEIMHAVGYLAGAVANWQRFPLDSPTPLAEAVRMAEPILLESPETVAARYPQLPTLNSASIAAVPLIVNERATGVLGLSFSTAQAFSEEDRTFLLTLAHQCALALERARLYESERLARAELQEALRMRDGFLSIAAHELKNPLTALLGNAQILQRRAIRAGNQSERDQRSLAGIVDQAARLNRMITLLLDVSHMEAGQLSIERSPLDLIALIQRIAAEVRPMLKHHSLTIHAPAGSLMINGDVLRLEQVVQNLLQNAMKYSPTGGPITLQVERHEQRVCIAFTDQGIGIPADVIPRLFQRFYRAASAATSGIAGLGIGLYVVKEIVTLHGGTISVNSIEGAGSTFTICLPLTPKEAPDSGPPSATAEQA